MDRAGNRRPGARLLRGECVAVGSLAADARWSPISRTNDRFSCVWLGTGLPVLTHAAVLHCEVYEGSQTHR